MSVGYDSICCFRNRHNDGFRILLEITNRCNENCVFCHAKDQNELFLDDIKKIIKKLEIVKIHDVILTGGEPLLHKQLFEILEWFRQNNIACDLCTNGTMVTPEVSERLAEYLSEISISLDTVNPSIYDALRGTKDGLKRALEGIRNLQKDGIDVHLTDVLTKENYAEVSEVIDVARKLDVHSISFLAVIVDVAKDKANTDRIALSEHEKSEVMKVINHYRRSTNDIIINTKRMCECPDENCRAGENILGITSEGKLLGCIMHRDKEVDLLHGNVHEQDILSLGENVIPC